MNKDKVNTKGADIVILGNEPGNEKITTTPALALIESQIKTEVAKIDISRQAIVALKKKYGALEITGLDDKKGYEAVDEARKDVKKKAKAVDNKRMEINARFLAVTRGVNAYAGELEEPLRELQKALEAKLKVIDDQKAEAQRLKEEEEAKQLNDRITALEGAGISFNGQWYSIGENIALDILTIKGLDGEQFDILVENVKAEKERLDRKAEEARLELERQEREREEERQRLETQRLEQENREKDLQRQQNELTEMLAEAKRNQVVNRQSTMISHGFTYNPTKNYFSYNHFSDAGNVMVYDASIENSTPDEWAVVLAKALELKAVVSEANQKEAQRIETQTNQNNARIAELKALGFAEITGGLKIMSGLLERSIDVVMHDVEEDTIKQWEKRVSDIKKTLEGWKTESEKIIEVNRVRVEKARKEALTDFEKVREYLTEIENVRLHRPSLSNSDMMQDLQTFESELTDAISNLETTAEQYTK